MVVGEESCMEVGDGVHVCFTDSIDRRACMFHRTTRQSAIAVVGNKHRTPLGGVGIELASYRF